MTNEETPAIIKLLRLMRTNIVFISVVTFAVTVFSVVCVVSIPRKYTSKMVLLPEVAGNGLTLSGSIGALASMAGVKLGGSTEDAIYPEFYPKVLSSTVFIANMLKEKVNVARLGREVTIYEYFNDYQKHAWWHLSLPDKNKDDNYNANPKKLTKGQQKIAKAFTSAFFCAVDKKTDMITVEVEVQDADVAAQMADLICNQLQVYITDYRTSKSRKDLEYVQKITDEVKRNYLAAQQKYADFSDSHGDLVLTSYTQVRDRLENEMQLAYEMYSQSMLQLQLAQAKVQERTPAFTVIQPSVVPLKPSAPKRMVTVFIVCVLSFSCSVLWLLGKKFYARYRF